ncbi:MAG: lamin tail domain-containing protein [Patescibacteria group bacterium]
MKILLFILLLVFAFPIFAENKIVINEFVVDPQPQQFELFNTSNESIDVGNWIIDDNGGSSGTFTIPAGTFIQPKSCQIFSKDFNLNKSSSDSARLLDASANLIDSFSYKSSPGQNVSYSRVPDGESSWSSASASIGYYNSDTKNACNTIPSPTPASTVTEEPTPTPTSVPAPTARESYDNMYINEVMVNPDSGEKEWVELYNDNDFPVSLVDWYMDDEENGGSSPRKFSLDIPAKDFKGLVLDSIIFNNDGDQVRLLDFDKNLKDDFEYPSSIQGKTYGRSILEYDKFCRQNKTYEMANSSCIGETTPTPTQTPAPVKPTTGLTITPVPEPKKPKTYKAAAKSKPITPTVVMSGTTEVLGVSDKRNPGTRKLIKHLAVISFTYSLLTLVSVLIKMTGIYAKSTRFRPWFIYSP